jgi:hypothetical protein
MNRRSESRSPFCHSMIGFWSLMVKNCITDVKRNRTNNDILHKPMVIKGYDRKRQNELA